MSDSDLLLKPVAELADLIKSRSISPVDLATATISQIEHTESALNAFLDVYSDEMMASARNAERDITNGKHRWPLHGIPIGLKDLIDVQGKPTTGGSAATSGEPALRDATVTARFRDAGALIAGKLNLVEFAFGFSSCNPHTGDVHNPWNLDRVAAGSSSGSGAAVASGSVAAALGTDTGGSVRMPAAACGITGLKPTYGLVSRYGVMDLSWSSDHVGPMCRTAADCALLMDVIAGHDPSDPASSKRVIPSFASRLDIDLKGMKIGVPKDYFFDGVDSEITAAVRNAIALMRAEGATIVDLSMPWVEMGRAINVGVLLPEAASVHRTRLSENADKYSPAVRYRLEAGSEVSAVDYIHAQRARAMFGAQMASAMDEVDVLVTPTVPIQTPTIAEMAPPPGSPTASSGGEFPNFTGVFNATGQPSVSLNCGFTADNMPIGMMISGKAFGDATVLGVAHAYQRITDWHCQMPSALS